MLIKLIYKNILLILTSTALIAGCSLNEEGSVAVYYDQVSGRCLYAGQWVPVSSDLFTWVVHNPKGNRKKEHSKDFLKVGDSSSISRERPKYVRPKEPFSDNERQYLHQKKVELKNEQLVFAESIFKVRESRLYFLNMTNLSPNPFKSESDQDINVPGDWLVCELKKNTLMNGSKITFTKNLFGDVKVISDETVPRPGNDKTFGREILEMVF